MPFPISPAFGNAIAFPLRGRNCVKIVATGVGAEKQLLAGRKALILHINMNYIAGSLYSAMLAHMPQPEEHVVYAPAARKARTYTLMKQELGHPEVHVIQLHS